MRKRILSLLCVLALCLGLLPVTALAAEGAPHSLYVGNTSLSLAEDSYWTTDPDTGLLTQCTGSGDDWNVKYDPRTATLTLSGATIKGGSDVVSIPYGSGIYALSSSNQPVTLTIELIGENTITGTFGIYVNATPPTTPGTDASLVIKKSGDNGSLTVTGTGNSGLHIISGTGNASLTIQNASVDAKTTQTSSSYAGVCVQSGATATDAPNISLSVDGGSLTASGGTSSDGILFYVGSSKATGAITSLTVTDNAIVDARNGGISASNPNSSDLSDQIVVGSGTGTSGGIVFDGSTGTVYGSVTLQEDLEISEGESLTIGDEASLDTNGKLTVNGGTLNGTPSGDVTYKVTGVSLNKDSLTLDVGSSETLNAAVAPNNATIQKVTWTSNEERVATVDESGKVEAVAPGTANITVTTQDGSHTATCAVTVTQPVTGVTLDPTSLSLFTGDTATLTATVEPENATNKNVTWSSDKPEVATVENGKVTAKAAGTATITATAEDDSNISATCTVTVTQSEYSISADTTALDFGSAYTGYTQPAAQTVTVKNAGNQSLTLNQPASTNSFEVGTLTKTVLAAGEAATFTVQPKAGLAVGTYSENITISDSGHVTLSIPATFTVRQYSSSGGTPSKTPSQQATDKIESAKEGSTVAITLRTGQTTLDKEVFEELAGRDVTLEISVPGGIMWTVNGQDIPENADLTDLDMGVSLNTSTIPVNLINSVTGEAGTVQLTLKHNGEFGFKMMLTAPVGVKNSGLWANLYHYDEDAGKMVYQAAALVDEDGNVALPFDHASQYALVLDSKSHDLPFTDLAADAWYTDAVAYVYRHDLMAGYGENLFGPDDDLSRAQLCQIIYNMEGQPATSGSSVFTDVADGAWYADAVTWAASQGIVGGYGGGLFGPEDNITREQLASILYRYAQAKGYDTSVGEDTNILSYTDALEISEYAIPAMQWACGAGIMEGNAGYLTPQGDATRAQVATMLMRFCENYATTK